MTQRVSDAVLADLIETAAQVEPHARVLGAFLDLRDARKKIEAMRPVVAAACMLVDAKRKFVSYSLEERFLDREVDRYRASTTSTEVTR